MIVGLSILLMIVITVVLIKKSVKTQDTKIDWAALAQGNLTVGVTMNFLLPFAATLENVKLTLLAGSTPHFEAKIPTLKLNPGLNVFPITFKALGSLSAIDIASLLTQKKYLNITGDVLGLGFERTEDLS